MRSLRLLAVIWIVFYPVLPPGPLLAFAIASIVGRPFVVGYDTAGWPVLGPITPAFVFWTIAMPWTITSAILLAASRAIGRRRTAS